MTAPFPCLFFSRISLIFLIAETLSKPSNGPELISLPSPGVATPVDAGSSSPVSTTTWIGNLNAFAKSKSL